MMTVTEREKKYLNKDALGGLSGVVTSEQRS